MKKRDVKLLFQAYDRYGVVGLETPIYSQAIPNVGDIVLVHDEEGGPDIRYTVLERIFDYQPLVDVVHINMQKVS